MDRKESFWPLGIEKLNNINKCQKIEKKIAGFVEKNVMLKCRKRFQFH